MSSALPPKPRVLGRKSRICVVASKYNETFTDALVENAVAELEELVPQGKVDVIRVPGAFEIPVTVAAVIEREQPSCVIALGLIIRGATQHGDLIAESITQGLQTLAIRTKCPVIHEVLLVNDEEQAYARCIGDALNRGKEAARSAAVMLDVFHELERSTLRTTPTRPTRNA
ncbi:MAG: 6,7-dimethyl-8-ribityllumazine synthase [Luteolibacter sp.]